MLCARGAAASAPKHLAQLQSGGPQRPEIQHHRGAQHQGQQTRTLAALEKRVLEEANTLGIGPMGFGGGTTLIGCKVGTLARLPASFFVTVSYMCWAFRRATLNVAADGTSTLSQ